MHVLAYCKYMMVQYGRLFKWTCSSCKYKRLFLVNEIATDVCVFLFHFTPVGPLNLQKISTVQYQEQGAIEETVAKMEERIDRSFGIIPRLLK